MLLNHQFLGVLSIRYIYNNVNIALGCERMSHERLEQGTNKMTDQWLGTNQVSALCGYQSGTAESTDHFQGTDNTNTYPPLYEGDTFHQNPKLSKLSLSGQLNSCKIRGRVPRGHRYLLSEILNPCIIGGSDLQIYVDNEMPHSTLLQYSQY